MPHKILYWLLACVALNRACSLVPDVLFDPFPFYDIDISVQYYVYAIAQHGIVLVLMFLIYDIACDLSARYSLHEPWSNDSLRSSRLCELINKLFVIEILSLADFLLIYEHPIFYVAGYGVEFTDVKVILYAYLIFRWKQS